MRRIPLLLMVALLSAPFAVKSSEADTPQARWGHMFVYFPPSDSFVLFGGASERGTYRRDMWEWDGKSWRRLDVAVPRARGFVAAAYDPAREVIIMHGGRGDDRVTFNELWSWDGSEWKLLDADTLFHSDHHQMAYSPEAQGVVIFGGWTGEDVSGQTWVWNGDWKLMAEGEGPPPRSAFGMTYNPSRQRIELYGGLWINGQYADAWAWEGARWKMLSGPYDNSSLDHLSLFYDSASGETLVFGGKDYRRTMRRETRKLTSSGLVEIIASAGPGPRHSTPVALDTRRNRGVLFGGKEYRGDEHLPLNDLWLWEDGSWRLLSSPKAGE